MLSGKTLTEQQAAAIRSLVSHAVSELTIENVYITDTEGNTYTGSVEANLTNSSNLKMALEQQVNNQVRSEVLQVLSPLFGLENLRVSVHSTVDVSRVYREDTIYEEPDWAKDGSTNGQGIIGSRVWSNSLLREGETTAGGVVGTSTNTSSIRGT